MAATAKRTVLTFVTGNKKKLEEMLALLPDGFAFNVVNHKVDLPELQGEPREVSAEKCKLAADAINGPVLVEDTSLCFNALNGMPGVYIKWFLKKCGHDGLNKMIQAYDDKSGYAQCVFSFSPHPKATPVTFVGRCHGTIVPARGPTDFGWDPVFQPDGYEETYAEMDKEIKNGISHRGRAVAKLLKYLVENQEEVERAIREKGEAPTPTGADAGDDEKK